MKKAAVIGLGDISPIHLAAIAGNPDIELCAVCDIDPDAVINVFHTLNFVGGWWGGHVDEPMPTAVPDPDKPARMASRQARLSEQDSLQQDDGK